jgi:site-specific DNA-methyltransferase (adenine-specific)
MKESNVYLEDCMIGMARYPDKYFDLAIVDPPYGIDRNGMNMGNSVFNKDDKKWDNSIPTNEYFIELFRVSKNQIIWGGNFLGLCGGVLVWNKNGTAFGEGEIAICSTHKSVQIFEYTWNGMLQGDMKNKETRIHPTQKPVALYKWILDKYAKQGDKILDTHLGSGSIAIACHDYGFDLTACELDKEYFDKAMQRIKNHTNQTKLFV